MRPVSDIYWTVLLAACLLIPAALRAQDTELPAPPLCVVQEPAASPTIGSECLCQPNGDSARGYADIEYVLWWLREGRIPAILTTSPAVSKGVLGQPGTQVLYGDDRLMTRHDDRFNGTRLTLGYWLTPEQTLGIEGRGVILERDSTHFSAVSDGSTVLALPYVNAVTGAPASQLIASPGVSSGGFVGYSRIELFTEEVNLMRPLLTGPAFRLDLLAGARFAQMRDRTDLISSGALLPSGSTIFGIEDHLRTHNAFYGGQLGVKGEYNWSRWFVNFRGEAALGDNAESVDNFGVRVNATPTIRTVTPLGLAVLPSNTGTFSRNALNSVYEVGLNAGYQLSDRWRVYAGYTLFLWASPIRSGDQVNTVLNTSQITGPLVGPALPSIPFTSDFFWAQGINAGLQFRW